jgi:hypothetical protein
MEVPAPNLETEKVEVLLLMIKIIAVSMGT